MIKKFLLLLTVLLLQVPLLFCQNNVVSVDHATGTASVVLPLFTVRNGNVNVPVNLVYNGTGVRLKDMEGTGGISWDLQAGGGIEREIRGLPDDCKKDRAGSARLGWLYNDNGVKINDFNVANDNNTATCTDETADLNFINANFGNLSDTEPDIFMVSAPGLSCRLIFDNNHSLRTISYQDIKVSYTTGADGSIQAFTIVNDQGMEYVFDSYDVVRRKTQTANPAGISFFQRDFDLYKNGVDYNNSWKLYSVKDIAGNTIFFEYLAAVGDPAYTQINSRDSVKVGLGNGSSYSTSLQYITTESYSRVLLKSILIPSLTSPRYWIFNYNAVDQNYPKSVINSIVCPEREIKFDYLITAYPNSAKKAFLSRVYTASCETPDVHTFDYVKNSIYQDIVLPDSSSTEVDAWGYYNANGVSSLMPAVYIDPSASATERYRIISPGNNPSYSFILAGNNRDANPAAASIGALNKITYPNGGSTILTYESNDYYDPVAGAVVQGGGIRVSQIKDYDPASESNSMVRSFSYTEPATGRSSGKPISLPQMAFTRPYNGTGDAAALWNYSTVRLEEDQSSEASTVMYTSVKESVTGAGSTLQEFTVPAAFWDETASPDWAPTYVYHARSSCTPQGFLKNTKNTYPFPPNPNFGFERGLLKRAVQYNDAGQALTETVYEYQRTGTPVPVIALKFDNNTGILAYARYKTLAGTGMLLKQESSKNYDLSTGLAQTSTVNYSYEGGSHKLPTKIESSANGEINRSYTRYTKDYNLSSSGADVYSAALKKLQDANINIPVEIYHQKEIDGDNRTISARLSLFKDFPLSETRSACLPFEYLTFNSPEGISNFEQTMQLAGILKYDQRYLPERRILAYDSKGFIQTEEDKSKNVQTVFTDSKTQQVVAAITGATSGQMAFNDFDSAVQPSNRFLKSDNVYNYVAGRSGNNGISLPSSGILSATIGKNLKAGWYIFSTWIKSPASGSLTLTLTGTGQVFNLSYPADTAWKYRELKIPVANAPGVFTIEVKSDQTIHVDDILFYPETAEITTSTYDGNSLLKTSETNTNGVSSYFSYDAVRRLVYIKNQDKHILLKKTYINPDIYSRPISISAPGTINAGTAVQFLATYICGQAAQGLIYTWNFGDGSPVVTTSSGTAPLHTYNTGGNYLVQVSVSNPSGNTRSQSINIYVIPGKMTIILRSSVSKGYISSVEFYQNDIKVATMSPTLNTPYVINQGTYKLRITYSGNSLFKSIGINTDGADDCVAIGSSSGTVVYILNANNSNYITINASGDLCAM